MPRIARTVGTAGSECGGAKRFSATRPPRRLPARAPRPGTPGLIATGPGLSLPGLQDQHWQFSGSPQSSDAALFAANLLRARVANPADWESTRDVGKFLQRTVAEFAGARATRIDYAFDISLSLSTSASNWHEPEEVDPHRVLLTFRVAHTVSWVNLTPALELLGREHEMLPAIFYYWLNSSLSRWFRIFDIQEARVCWDSWTEMHHQDELDRQEECARTEPTLPNCVSKVPRGRLPDVTTMTKSVETGRLMQAAQRLYCASRRRRCPKFDSNDHEDLADTDGPIPLIALAFGEHDVITEFLNMELDASGQVENAPWPILRMDGTNTESIRQAFQLADVALDTLEAASHVLSLVPGFEPLTKVQLTWS